MVNTVNTVWKSRQKYDHWFYGKNNIFSIKSTFSLVTKCWFHGNFWAWSFYTFPQQHCDFFFCKTFVKTLKHNVNLLFFISFFFQIFWLCVVQRRTDVDQHQCNFPILDWNTCNKENVNLNLHILRMNTPLIFLLHFHNIMK